jgi:DNA-binding NtrC family response regulator
MGMILLVEDEADLRREIEEFLHDQGHNVLSAADGAAALTILQDQPVQLVLTDLRMPKMDGLELLRKGRAACPEAAFVVMTAFGTMETAIEALRAGATDYLIKPVSLDQLLEKVNRIFENIELKAANRMLRRELDRKLGPLEMVGQSAALSTLRNMLQKVAPARSSVLITGESGTGKELIARALHSLGAPKGEPFVPVNCAAIPETLLESELFGHVKGSFTGAISDSEGLFRAARRGTMFLDEVGELPLSMQAKLLRALEERQVHPVGSSRYQRFDARVVAATNRDLKKEVKDGRFREDLYFRLAVVELHAPPLRDRPEDIPLLVEHLVRKFNVDLNRHYTGVEPAALKRLTSLPWKGNIRELQNVIERAMLIGNEPTIMSADLIPPALFGTETEVETPALRVAVAQFETKHVRSILERCGNDKRKAAAELGISLASLYRYLGDARQHAAAAEEHAAAQ